MNNDKLQNKKVAILVESQYIPEEIAVYREKFNQYGMVVDFMSRLWGNAKMTFISTVSEAGKTPETLDVSIDFDKVKLEDYAAVIMSANYTSVRLRHFEPPDKKPITADMVKTAPAVDFYARAMKSQRIIKGALCHGLWIITPNPELLRNRKVICNNVVLADIINAGGVFSDDPSGVVVDKDLVTGRTYHETALFVDKIVEQILKVENGESL
ncbi:MAG: ThiJ/PfpI protein [Firmicutes bacterium]|nr:ThiJ/PfpI protein [Bacillota bacterium]